MAITRLKKLTNSGYAPTDPTSEVQARTVVDDSIQEVADLLDAAKPDISDVLVKNNTVAYAPTFQYHPATKGYVDSVAISSTIPENSLTDNFLSSTAGNVKPRLATLEDAVDDMQPIKGTATLPTSGWVANTGDNALKYNLAISGVLAIMWAEVTIDKDYHDTALDAEINPTVEEYNGGITFFANSSPAIAIPIEYRVVR